MRQRLPRASRASFKSAHRLAGLYEDLRFRFGPQGWWPVTHSFPDPRFEVVAGAILTQHTAWANVQRALGRLAQARAGTPKAVASISCAHLEALIRSSGYFREKARKLREFSQFLLSRYHGNLDSLFASETPVLREHLLGVYGIGPETADCIILYAAGKPTFVVDAYTRRFCAAHHLVADPHRISYAYLQNYFMSYLPPSVDVYQEFHALIVRWGKEGRRGSPRRAVASAEQAVASRRRAVAAPALLRVNVADRSGLLSREGESE